MTLLADVLDTTALTSAVEAGLVRVQRHPDRPYVIYNYTEACQYANAWTAVTLACRGLIVDEPTSTVLARPYPKFFNHDQPGAPELVADAEVLVTDKADGSLGSCTGTRTAGRWRRGGRSRRIRRGTRPRCCAAVMPDSRRLGA